MRKERYLELSGNLPEKEIPYINSPLVSNAGKKNDSTDFETFTDWKPGDLAQGKQIEQWLAGMAGAFITTLPSFIILPLWFLFTNRNKVQTEDGGINGTLCFFINFLAGVLIWIAFLLGTSIG